MRNKKQYNIITALLKRAVIDRKDQHGAEGKEYFRGIKDGIAQHAYYQGLLSVKEYQAITESTEIPL